MAFIPVPGVAQTVIKGQVGGSNWALVWHWQLGQSQGAWPQAQLQVLADVLSNSWKTHFQTEMNANTTFSVLDAVDLTNTTPATAVGSTASFAGTSTFGILPASACMLISFLINARYKGGHPRTYLPIGGENNMATQDEWAPVYASSIESKFATMVGDVVSALPGSGAGAAQHVAPRYVYQLVNDSVHHKYIRQRMSLLAVPVIQSYTGKVKIATQRRRIGAGG